MSKTHLAFSIAIAALIAVGPSARSQTSSPAQLPDGRGEDVVLNTCSACHGLGRVVHSGHTREDWLTVLDMMVNVGALLPQNQISTVADYLAQNFPEKALPPAVAIPGDVRVSFKEWAVPTPGSRPHDPLAAADGSIWYTGHMANVVGRIDPKTGTIREFHPITPNSGPHGITQDKAGNIWFTGNFKGYIGKLDPKTGAFTEYPLPDPKARDPHTPLFDPSGILWFTVQSANMVGRLDPKTGEIKLVSSPTPRSNPYGMVMTLQGIPVFCEFGSNKIATVDPETMAIHEYVLSNERSRPRRIAITPDDMIFYGDYSRGYLGRLDLKTGAQREWPSPGGSRSLPYGITYLDGAIWYSESGVKPNTLVRFDLKRQTFQTWAIPSGGSVVRNMMSTRDGNLVLAESGVNRVALVEIAKQPR